MTQAHSSQTIADLRPGEHICYIYETEKEHRTALTPFLSQGLERGEKVVYIADAHTAETVLGYLRDEGWGLGSYRVRGQLSILTADDTYMWNGVFAPERMIEWLQTETERALAEGYPALRVTGEMTLTAAIGRALRGLHGSERLIEYEANLNGFFPTSWCMGLCQYSRRRFSPAVLLNVLRTHPKVLIGTKVHENPYYADLRAVALSAEELRRWAENMVGRNWFASLIPRQLRREVEAIVAEFVAGETEPAGHSGNPVLTKDTKDVGGNPSDR